VTSDPSYKTIFLLTLILIFSTLLSAQSQSPQWNKHTKLVGTFYFYWFDVYSGYHFYNPDGSDSLTDHPPNSVADAYSFKLIDWHKQELAAMMKAGIDIVLPVYWGDKNNLFWSLPGVDNLVAAVKSLSGGKKIPPRIGMFFDTSCLPYQNNKIPPDLTTKAGKSLFYEMIFDYFQRVPKNLWAAINDRPIIYLFFSQYVSKYNQKTFNFVYNNFKKDFGVKPYIIKDKSWQGVKVDGEYVFGTAIYGAGTWGSIGSLGPGYDDLATQRSQRTWRKRQCGEFYEQGWELIKNMGARLVSIETWNEWHEASEIAASREYGDYYIDLTAKYIKQWKAAASQPPKSVWLDFCRDPLIRGINPVSSSPDGAWKTKKKHNRDAAYPAIKSSDPSYYIYLDLRDDFIHAQKNEVWITVDYLDEGSDSWNIEYDSLFHPYSGTPKVTLQNSGLWKSHTFHITDAFFGGRQNWCADLRLSNNHDGKTNYFSRILVSKSPLINHAPILSWQKNIKVKPGKKINIKIRATDPDGNKVNLKLERKAAFISLVNNGDGSGVISISPKNKDVRSYPYPIVLTATDNGTPALSDAISFRVTVKK